MRIRNELANRVSWNGLEPRAVFAGSGGSWEEGPILLGGVATAVADGGSIGALRPGLGGARSTLGTFTSARVWTEAIGVSLGLHAVALIAILTWAAPAPQPTTVDATPIEIIVENPTSTAPSEPKLPIEAPPSLETSPIAPVAVISAPLTPLQPSPSIETPPTTVARAPSPPPPETEAMPLVGEPAATEVATPTPVPAPLVEPVAQIAAEPPAPLLSRLSAEAPPPTAVSSATAEAPPPIPVPERLAAPIPTLPPAVASAPSPAKAAPAVLSQPAQPIAAPADAPRVGKLLSQKTLVRVTTPVRPTKVDPLVRETRASTQARMGAADSAKPAQTSRQAVSLSAAEAVEYQQAVVARLSAVKRYPDAARERAPNGVAVVSFSIGASGAVGAVSIAQSAGDTALDAEALATVRRASPFPPPPSGAPRTFAAPLSFRIR
jgi:periplasmic protein TonB